MDLFTTKQTGFSYYDQFLNTKDAAYLKDKKNLVGKIEYMTPDQYIEACAEYGFSEKTTPEKLISSRESDKGSNSNLLKLIKDGKQWYLPYLNKASKAQEGLHRAVLAKKLGVNKIPVLVIDYADMDRAEKEKKENNDYTIWTTLQRDFSRYPNYLFDSIEDIKDEIEFTLYKYKDYFDDYTYDISGFQREMDPSHRTFKIDVMGLPIDITVEVEGDQFRISKISCPNYSYMLIEHKKLNLERFINESVDPRKIEYFNFEIFPQNRYGDEERGEIKLEDVPYSVRRELCRQILKYPSNFIQKIYNDEFDSDEDFDDIEDIEDIEESTKKVIKIRR